MPFLWLKCGEIVGNFIIRSDDKFKIKGDGSVCQVFSLDASTVKINGTAVPSGADGWTEVTVTELGFLNTSEQTPLAVTGAAAAAGPGSAATAGAATISSISPVALAGLFQGLSTSSAGGESVFIAEFRVLDGPYHASLIAAQALAQGLRGKMCVESKSCIRFKLIYDKRDFLETFVQDMVMRPPSTEVGSTVEPADVAVVESHDRDDVVAFRTTDFNETFARLNLKVAYNDAIRLHTPSGLGRGSHREVLSVASRSSHEEE